MTHRVQPTRTRAARGSRSTALALGLLMAAAVHAQQPPAAQVQKSEPALAPPGAQTAPQAAPPAAAPSWQQGRSDAQSKSRAMPRVAKSSASVALRQRPTRSRSQPWVR